MNKIILSFLVPFIIRQIVKFGTQTDWQKVKADAELRVRKLVPGEFFDDAAVGLVEQAVEASAALFQDEDQIKKLAEMVKNKEYILAIEDLLAYLLSKIQ